MPVMANSSSALVFITPERLKAKKPCGSTGSRHSLAITGCTTIGYRNKAGQAVWCKTKSRRNQLNRGSSRADGGDGAYYWPLRYIRRIKVFPYTEYVDGLAGYAVWWLGSGNGEWREVKVNGCGVHGSGLTALLEQYTDRTAAMKLKGLQVAIPRSQLPVLSKSGKDGYYWSDLIGLEVVNLQSEELGKVTGLLETGANDVLQVQS